LPDFRYFIQWISLNNQRQLFASECGDRVFGFRMPAFNQFDEPLRRLFLIIFWLIFPDNTDYLA
jgi:hypothetical protein